MSILTGRVGGGVICAMAGTVGARGVGMAGTVGAEGVGMAGTVGAGDVGMAGIVGGSGVEFDSSHPNSIVGHMVARPMYFLTSS